MGFYEQLRKAMRSDWRFFYVDFGNLKKFLANRTSDGRSFSESDESDFLKLLEEEISRAGDFQSVKLAEITRHVQHLEQKKVDWSNPEVVSKVRREVDELTADLVDLSEFIELYRTAVMKACKKHDRRTSFLLSAMFKVRLPEHGATFLDPLVARLSKLYAAINEGGIKAPEQPSDGASAAQTFVRKTTKFWVPTQNVPAIKGILLKHLPVFFFDAGNVDPLIQSVYLDDGARHSVFYSRLDRTQSAQAIRLRWYGKVVPPREVFVERKTHAEDWTGETSVKERFCLKEKQVNSFLNGQLPLEDVASRVRKRGKTEEEVSSVVSLAAEVRQAISERRLEPSLRTSYNRMAFQSPSSAKVRVSLDTELSMIRERDKTGGNWRRVDFEAPEFRNIPDAEICRFPHAILEVKLQLSPAEAPPPWITGLVEGPLLEAVPKFSKFIHGTASLFQGEVERVPYWLPQVNAVDASQIPGPTAEVPIRPEAAPSMAADQRKRSTACDPEQPRPRPAPGAPSISQPQHRIAVPVRVEPKVFFANERTFLSWLHFSIFLGSASMALIGLGGRRARLSGMTILGASILIATYALARYEWRATQIRRRDPGPYDDRVGPVFVVLLFAAVMVTTILFSVL